MPENKTTTIDMKQVQSDHDLIVTLVTTQKLNHETLLEKIGSVQTDVLEVKSGVAQQLADQNVRLMALETFRQTKAADDKIKFWNDQSIWTQTFRGRWKWIVWLVGIVAGIVGYFASTLIPLLQGGQ